MKKFLLLFIAPWFRLIGGLILIVLFVQCMKWGSGLSLPNDIMENSKKKGYKPNALFYTDEPASADAEAYCRESIAGKTSE